MEEVYKENVNAEGRALIEKAELYHQNNQYNLSEVKYLKAIEYCKILIDDYDFEYVRDLALACKGYARLLRDADRINRAIELQITSLHFLDELESNYAYGAILLKIKGQQLLGELYLETNQLVLAEEAFQKSLDFILLDYNDPQFMNDDARILKGNCLDFLARTKKEKGQIEEAIEIYKEVLQILLELNANQPGKFDDQIKSIQLEL